MGLDVRLPVGLLFSAIGFALIVYGLLGDPAIYAKSLGVNVNLWWGLVLLAFGIVMLLLGVPKAARPKSTKPGAHPVAR
jgi:formate hydrogenlyase subunit 3/multisubunit Na+/H+ antiporter MnhD subunit